MDTKTLTRAEQLKLWKAQKEQAKQNPQGKAAKPLAAKKGLSVSVTEKTSRPALSNMTNSPRPKETKKSLDENESKTTKTQHVSTPKGEDLRAKKLEEWRSAKKTPAKARTPANNPKSAAKPAKTPAPANQEDGSSNNLEAELSGLQRAVAARNFTLGEELYQKILNGKHKDDAMMNAQFWISHASIIEQKGEYSQVVAIYEKATEVGAVPVEDVEQGFRSFLLRMSQQENGLEKCAESALAAGDALEKQQNDLDLSGELSEEDAKSDPVQEGSATKTNATTAYVGSVRKLLKVLNDNVQAPSDKEAEVPSAVVTANSKDSTEKFDDIPLDDEDKFIVEKYAEVADKVAKKEEKKQEKLPIGKDEAHMIMKYEELTRSEKKKRSANPIMDEKDVDLVKKYNPEAAPEEGDILCPGTPDEASPDMAEKDGHMILMELANGECSDSEQSDICPARLSFRTPGAKIRPVVIESDEEEPEDNESDDPVSEAVNEFDDLFDDDGVEEEDEIDQQEEQEQEQESKQTAGMAFSNGETLTEADMIDLGLDDDNAFVVDNNTAEVNHLLFDEQESSIAADDDVQCMMQAPTKSPAPSAPTPGRLMASGAKRVKWAQDASEENQENVPETNELEGLLPPEVKPASALKSGAQRVPVSEQEQAIGNEYAILVFDENEGDLEDFVIPPTPSLRRCEYDEESEDDTAGAQRVPVSGTPAKIEDSYRVEMVMVSAKKKIREELGTEKVITSVRRSARKAGRSATPGKNLGVREMLEETNFTVKENEMLQSAKKVSWGSPQFEEGQTSSKKRPRQSMDKTPVSKKAKGTSATPRSVGPLTRSARKALREANHGDFLDDLLSF